MNDILTEKEVAELLDCEPATAQARARDGKVPAVKWGRSWCFPKVALLEAINEQARQNMQRTEADRPRAKAMVLQPERDSQRKAPPVLPSLRQVRSEPTDSAFCRQ